MRDKQAIRQAVIPFRVNQSELRLLKAICKKLGVDRSAAIRAAIIDAAEEAGVDQWIILAACGGRVDPEGTVKA